MNLVCGTVFSWVLIVFSLIKHLVLLSYKIDIIEKFWFLIVKLFSVFIFMRHPYTWKEESRLDIRNFSFFIGLSYIQKHLIFL